MVPQKIKYFNFIYFSGTINIDYIPEVNIFLAPFKVVGKALFFSLQTLATLIRHRHVYRSREKIVFFAMSENNYQSVRTIFEGLEPDEAVIFGDRKFNKDITLFIPCVLSAWLAVVFIPKLVIDFFRMNEREKTCLRKGMNDVILTYPFYYVSYLWFKIVKPKGIVIVNDHVYSTRVLVFWANKFNVPSFYIQHASVTEGFPALEVSYAFLEGIDAKEKYLKAGSDPEKIELIGIPKMDGFFDKINYRTSIRTLGVASNGLETLSQVHDTIVFLNKHFPDIKIIYRPHRFEYFGNRKIELEDLMEKIKKLTIRANISNPFEENVMDYLARLDCLITGDSGIHLEAAWLNVTSLYFHTSSKLFDYYGFVKHGMIDHPKDLDELKQIIDNLKNTRKETRSRAKRYCSTIGSENDGKSTALTIKLIRDRLAVA